MSIARKGQWLLSAMFSAMLLAVALDVSTSERLAGAQEGVSPVTQPTGELEALQKEVAKQPDWTEGWWKLGTGAYEADRFDLAISALRHVVEASPRMGLAWNLLGLSQFGAKMYPDARQSLERGATLANSADPEVDQVAAYHLDLLRIREGRFEQAAASLRTTFGSHPNAQASIALGLAVLQVPLLPAEVDPSHEVLLTQIGIAVAQGTEGLSQFATVVSANPAVPFLHLAYGQTLLRNGHEAEARAELQREVSVSPLSAEAWKALADADRHGGRMQAATTADARAASLVSKQGGETSLRRSWFALRSANHLDRGEGMQAYAGGQYAHAAQVLSAWVATHPEDGTAWAVLGLSEFSLHQDDNARVHLGRGSILGLQGDPQAMATAHYTLGVLLLQAGEFDRASTELSAAEKLADSEKTKQALGYVLLRKATIPPGGEDELAASAGTIEALLLQSRYDEAFPAFRALLARYPQTPSLHYAFGTALMALSEFDEASVQMQAERKIAPSSGLPLEGLASIALRQHRPAEAVPEARRAAELMPAAAEPHYLLGRALLESGADPAEAVRELQKAAERSPNSPEVHFSLAKAYARLPDVAKAEQERQIFARLHDLSEAQRGGAGAQSYASPRTNGLLSGAAAPGNSPQ